MVTLRPCGDVSAAAWITSSDLPWQQLVTFGPAGFDAYARLRFLPDPVRPGQREAATDADGPSERQRLLAALEVLRQHTRTPADCYFCLWDGWPSNVDGDDGAPAPSLLNGPKVLVPNRAYFLFRGSSAELADWGAAGTSPGRFGSSMPDPAFIWPADHAWCVANDVDPHYAGIGASATAIAQLVAHPGLDVVTAVPSTEQPHYG